MLKKIALLSVVVLSLIGCATHPRISGVGVKHEADDFSVAATAIPTITATPMCPVGFVQVDKGFNVGVGGNVINRDGRYNREFAASGYRTSECVPAVEKAAPAPATTKQPTKRIPLSVLDSRDNYAVGWGSGSNQTATQPGYKTQLKPAWKSPRQKWEEKEAKRKQAQYARVPAKRVGHKGYVESDIPGLAPAVMAWRMENLDIPPCNSSNGGTVAANVSSKETKSGFQRERLDFQVKCK